MPANLDGWNRIRARVAEMGRAHLRVGVVGDKAHQIHADTSLSIGVLAIIHELGNPRTGLPARSFVESTLQLPEVRAEIAAMERVLLKQVILGHLDRDAALHQIGKFAAGKIRERMLAGEITPPLAPSTIARKADDRPLIDTRELVDAVGFEIVR